MGVRGLSRILRLELNVETKLDQYIRVKIKTHRESIERIREIQDDVVSGKLSMQEAKLSIDEEEDSVRHQLKTFRDYYDLSDEDVKISDG